MAANYDPDHRPEPSADMVDLARELGLKIVNVICDEDGARVGENTGVSFLTMTNFLPSVGHRIELEDGKTCEVKRVYFKLARYDNQPVLDATVYAVLISK